MALYDPVYGYPNQPMFQTPGINPYVPQGPIGQQPTQPPITQAPIVKIITLAGEAAAKSLKLAAGSTLLASDENDSVIWFIKANDVGPNTVIKIPFDPAIFSGNSGSSPDITTIENRLASIEERMTRYESNVEHDKQRTNNGNSNNSSRH